MAVGVSLPRRQRSSTGASRALNAGEKASTTADLVQRLSNLHDSQTGDEVARGSAIIDELKRELAADSSSRDIFRHGKGFEAVLHVLQRTIVPSGRSLELYGRMIRDLLILLSLATREHRGNKKYFTIYLNGWNVLHKALEDIQTKALEEQSDGWRRQFFASVFQGLIASALEDESFDAIRDGPNGQSGDSDAVNGYQFSGNEILYHPEACAVAIRLCLRSLQKGVENRDEQVSTALPVIQIITAVVEVNIRNRVALWKTSLLSDLLPSLLEVESTSQAANTLGRLYACLTILGLPSLDDVALLFSRSSDSDQARSLLLTTLQDSTWPPFIQFDLSFCGYSSIELPSLPRPFPPTIGYSLTAWIRVDSFDTECHTTLFGAFDASQTCFILMYLEKDSHQLILQTSIRSSRPSVRYKTTRFAVNHWYHVALVHKKNVTDPTQSTAILFVDGEFAEQVKCAYPESPPELDSSQRTASPSQQGPPLARHHKPVQAFFGTPHDLGLKFGRNEVLSRWSLARAHLYQMPLSDEFVAVHHRLGPRYTGNLQDCLGPLLTYRASAELNRYNELLHPDKSDKSDIVTATEKRGSEVASEGRLLVSIYPTAIIFFDESGSGQPTQYELDRKAAQRYQQLSQKSKAVAINAAIPTLNEALSRSYGTGILTGDPVVAVPRALDDASWCLTGSLPILVRLLESASTKEAFLQAASILFECVVDNWRISEAMEKGNGFGLLAALIREKLGFETVASAATTRRPHSLLSTEDRQSLPSELLQLILNFVGYDPDKIDESMIVNPMAYRVLLIDFDTWRRCDMETQKLYYRQFVHFTSHNKHRAFNQKRLVRMRVVKKLIEALKSEEFSAEAVPHFMEALKALMDNISASPMFKELAMFVAFGLQEDRNMALKPMKSMASIVNLRQRSSAWAKTARGSRPSTPSGSQTPQVGVTRTELAIQVLAMLEAILCEDRSAIALRRFNKTVPNRWLLHLLAETDVRIINLAVRILCRSLTLVGSEFKAPFVEKNGGFITLKTRLKAFWRSPTVWLCSFAIMFGAFLPSNNFAEDFNLFRLVNVFSVDDKLNIENPEMLPVIMAMLEAGLRHIVKQEQPEESEVDILKTVIQFLSETYNRSASFREFVPGSRYVQEILFVLYPVLVGSDRLSAEMELQSDKDSLSFKGEEVKMRPHSNSVEGRPPSVRSLQMDSDRRTPSPGALMRIEAPRKPSSFLLVNSDSEQDSTSPAQFSAVMAPKRAVPVKINVGNSLVESLLEVVVSLFLDLICNKEKFGGIGLFLRVPPGFREHQAYFESYVLVHTLTQLWNHLQLSKLLFLETRVLTNLSRYSQHMSEAVFEGWFIDGAQPLLDFTGKILEYLQQPEIAANKNVRLCSQHINKIRLVFLRVCLWRLAELDESTDEAEATTFLDKMSYWQTILFSTENHETLFIRLMCFLLYTKLVSDVRPVRLAAARLWRTILVQKPTETATLLTYATGSDQRHLSTGFMKLVSMDDEEFITWIDENRTSLDNVFVDALKKPWDEFVNDENRRTEESAKNRLNKRREKLRQWQTEETQADEFMHRYEISTNHWRSNIHAQERLKLQRSVQDHQENVSHLLSVFSGIEKLLKQPSGFDPDLDDPKWQLDETEAVNRMRMRTIRDTSEHSHGFQPKRKLLEPKPKDTLTINTQISKAMGDNIMSSLPLTPLPSAEDETNDQTNEQMNDQTNDQTEDGGSKSDSASNSQLLEGGFEIVDDPREADDGLVEDKNRKVLTSLQRGDEVQQLYNVSRIVGLEACEGLLVVGKKCLYLQDNFFQRSDGEIVSVSQAPVDERDPYVQLISGKDIGSETTKHSVGEQETRHWTWTEVLSISKRRFLFRDVSIEIFFTDGRSYLLTSMSSKVRDDLVNAVVHRAPHVHGMANMSDEDAWRLDTLRNPEEGPQSFGSKFVSVFNSMPSHAATKRWVRGEMSNFQYLMLVNTLAGRTFNDLTQYPVFPWVLADYTSEELNLDDPKTFRDFSKPMGCQTKSREAEYKDRYRQFADMGDHNAPPFHYGTHYSSAMIVSSYLIRLQPFVQSYLLLQGGNFDHADRLFDSIEKAWFSAARDNMTDVRELTPEFFYLPEFLLNINKYDFGVKQVTEEVVNDVKLPPWAKGDPHIFVTKHREALESPYVSEHIHKWIDLIFGFKQRGEAAVEATNVFQHLSYQGAKDLDTIHDPVERLASIGIINSFGQTPHQVFQKPHPMKEKTRAAVARLDTLAESLIRLPDPLFQSDEKVASLAFSPTQERLLCAGPCKLNIMPNCDRYLEWDFADSSIRFFSSNTKRLLGLYENTHIGPITAATMTDSKTLVTAGTDSTIGIWSLNTLRDLIDIQPKTYMFGHRAPITLVTASRVFSTLLSASSDGHVLLWGLNRHQCIRVLHEAGEPAIQASRISNASGHILICQGSHILLYTLNGHLLVKQKICDSPNDQVTSCAFYEGAGNEWLEREIIFTGHTHGVANVWALTTLLDGAWYLQLVKRLNHTDSSREDGGNQSAAISAILPMPQAVYTGDEDGRVWEWDCVQRNVSISTRGR